MKLSLIIPLFNESDILESTISTLTLYMSKAFPDKDYEIIFSDDGSKDESLNIIKKFQDENLRVVSYSENKGKGAAVRNGIIHSKGDFVLFTDCDLAYGIDVILRAAKLFVETNADIIIGSRNLTDDGYGEYTPMRKFASKTYIKILALAAGFKLTDSQCGFKGFKREVAQTIFSKCEINGFAFDFEVLIIANKMKYNIIEMPVKIVNHRESKVNVFKDTIKMLIDVKSIKSKNR